jgi:hypothetical protein
VREVKVVASIVTYFCKARKMISRIFEYTKFKTTNIIKNNLNQRCEPPVSPIIVAYTNCHREKVSGNMSATLVEPLQLHEISISMI